MIARLLRNYLRGIDHIHHDLEFLSTEIAYPGCPMFHRKVEFEIGILMIVFTMRTNGQRSSDDFKWHFVFPFII